MKHTSLFDLSGKTALVTGASSGLGKRMAACLAEAGAHVILTARREDILKKLVQEIPGSSYKVMDVSSKESVEAVFKDLDKEGIKLDICINNAGIARRTPLFEDAADDTFEAVMQTNVMGVWYVTQAAAQLMKSHELSGSIINVASINGAAVPSPGGAAYSISKAAVIHLTKTLVGELSSHGIRINSISPGFFETPMTEEIIDQAHQLIPQGSAATPSDIDGLVLYLSSHKASQYVTGANFVIDGGLSWGGLKRPGKR